MSVTRYQHWAIVDAREFSKQFYENSDALALEFGGGEVGPVDIIATLRSTQQGAALLSEMGVGGGFYVKTSDAGSSYVILQGYAGNRPNLTGTRYSIANPKIVNFGMGPLGQLSALKGNFVVSMALHTTIDIMGLLNGKISLGELAGNLMWNSASTGLSGLAAMAATSGLVAMGVTMALPGVAAGIVVGVATSWALDALKNQALASGGIVEMMNDTATNYLDGVLSADTPIVTENPSATDPGSGVIDTFDGVTDSTHQDSSVQSDTSTNLYQVDQSGGTTATENSGTGGEMNFQGGMVEISTGQESNNSGGDLSTGTTIMVEFGDSGSGQGMVTTAIDKDTGQTTEQSSDGFDWQHDIGGNNQEQSPETQTQQDAGNSPTEGQAPPQSGQEPSNNGDPGNSGSNQDQQSPENNSNQNSNSQNVETSKGESVSPNSSSSAPDVSPQTNQGQSQGQ